MLSLVSPEILFCKTWTSLCQKEVINSLHNSFLYDENQRFVHMPCVANLRKITIYLSIYMTTTKIWRIQSTLFCVIVCINCIHLDRFYIDEIPIREVVRTQVMGGDFPSKPMSLYATIWDGSNWATSGGRYKVNYKYAPYIAEFANLILHGCAVDPTDHSSTCNKFNGNQYNSIKISSDQRSAMENFRRKYMTYSYCYDGLRYTKPPAECSIDHREAERLQGHRRRSKGHHQNPQDVTIWDFFVTWKWL